MKKLNKMKKGILLFIGITVAAICYSQTIQTSTRSLWLNGIQSSDSVNFATQNGRIWYGPNGIRFTEGLVKYSLKGYIATFGPAILGGTFVTGPGSSTNNAIALFNGTTGKIIKNSSLTFAGNILTSSSSLSINTTGAFNITASGGGSVSISAADFANLSGTISNITATSGAATIAASTDVLLSTGGTTRVFLNSSGNLGVGASPSHLIHATKNQNATTSVVVTNTDVTNGNSRAKVGAVNGTLQSSIIAISQGAGAGTYIGSESSHETFIMANGSTKLGVNPAGEVTITTVPTNDNTNTKALFRDPVSNKIETADISSGTYTPTFTMVTNADDAITSGLFYSRSPNSVTVGGHIQVDPTSASTTTKIKFTLPVNSNISAAQDAGGTAVCVNSGVLIFGHIQGDNGTGNGALILTFENNGDTILKEFSFTAVYPIKP